jgi:predicted amidohydrolase
LKTDSTLFYSIRFARAMRVALHQFAPEFPGREHNWAHIAEVAEATDADVVVFPELTSCGYMYKTKEEIAAYTDSFESLGPLERIARSHRRLIVGGFAERSGGRLFNSAYVVGPDRTRVFRKIHLWNYETEIFEPGRQALSFDFQGHRLGVIVCYDLQFPELASFYARQKVELLLVPMAWAEEPVPVNSDLQVYNHLAVATAFSHGMYVAVNNRVGREREAIFPGQSSFVDPYGRIDHLEGEEGTLVRSLDFSLIEKAKRPSPRNDLDSDPRLSIALPKANPGANRPLRKRRTRGKRRR